MKENNNNSSNKERKKQDEKKIIIIIIMKEGIYIYILFFLFKFLSQLVCFLWIVDRNSWNMSLKTMPNKDYI
jgi:hypothetical protein